MQTKTKLSPGPWIVLEPYTNRSAFPIAYQQGKVSHIIAEVNSQGGTPEQCRANADCMAAAPELLEALRLSERLADSIDFAGCGGHDHCNCQRCCALRSARAAIAKAEGRARCPGCGCYEVLPHEPGRPLLCKDCEPSAPIADFTTPGL